MFLLRVLVPFAFLYLRFFFLLPFHFCLVFLSCIYLIFCSSCLLGFFFVLLSFLLDSFCSSFLSISVLFFFQFIFKNKIKMVPPAFLIPVLAFFYVFTWLSSPHTFLVSVLQISLFLFFTSSFIPPAFFSFFFVLSSFCLFTCFFIHSQYILSLYCTLHCVGWPYLIDLSNWYLHCHVSGACGFSGCSWSDWTSRSDGQCMIRTKSSYHFILPISIIVLISIQANNRVTSPLWSASRSSIYRINTQGS